MDRNYRIAFAMCAVLLSMLFFGVVLSSALSAFAKFVLCAASLSACGMALAGAFRLEGGFGLILFKSRAGLSLLDSLSRRCPALWQLFADIGVVVGFGSLAHFILPKRKMTGRTLGTYISGIFLLVAITSLVAPLAAASLFSIISGGSEFAGAGAKLQTTISQFWFSKYLYLFAMAFGGVALLTTASLVLYSLTIVSGFASAVLSGNLGQISQITPGGTPIIPAVNLPLFEGIAALVVILAVHEAMHGIVARLYRLPLKSAGLAFFGFIPIGAFVDIDEKALAREKKERQSSVYIAGTAANFATSFLFLALLLLFAVSTEQYRVSGVFVESGTLPSGAQILSINGTAMTTPASFQLLPNATYSIETSAGTFERATDGNGKIGILYSVADASGKGGALRYAEGAGLLEAIFIFLSLTFALNFIIASINLVPLPLFDGYYIMKNGVGNGKAAAAIMYIVLAAFLINLLPWVLR